MHTLELDRALIDAPEEVIELREEVGAALSHMPIDNPQPEVAQKYTEAIGAHWSHVAEEVAREQYGDTIADTPRRVLYRLGGKVVMHAAVVEADALYTVIENNKDLGFLQRCVKRVRGKKKLPDVSCNLENAALDAFIETLNDTAIGEIKNPEDLGEVVFKTAVQFIPDTLATLDA